MKKFTFIVNPAFNSLLSEISSNAKKGRFSEAAPDDEEKDPTAPAEEPAAEEAPVEEPAAPEGEEDAAPAAPEPTPESPVDTADDAGNEADLASAELEKAKAKKASAEEELEEERYIKLVSPSGVTALLQLVLEPAIKTNTIDALARNLVDKLAIETPEDFQSFKADTIEFQGIVGFPQLIESMSPFIGGNQAALAPVEEPEAPVA